MKFGNFLKSGLIYTPHYVLLGNPVAQSVSPVIHNTAFDFHKIKAHYYALELNENDEYLVKDYLKNPNFLGANITIPFKQKALLWPDELTPEAEQIGAINTIYKRENTIFGGNTDVYGFLSPLNPFMHRIEGKCAIVFGTGGASKAIVYGLQKLGCPKIVLVSRVPEDAENSSSNICFKSYANWHEEIAETALIVNATPLGMIPDTARSPVDDSMVSLLEGKICYDIVYKPHETYFIRQARENGGTPVYGIEMLIHQASEAFEWWTGKSLPHSLIRTKLLPDTHAV